MRDEHDDPVQISRAAIRVAVERRGVAVDVARTLDDELLRHAEEAAEAAQQDALIAGLCRDGAREAALDAATRAVEETLATRSRSGA